MFIFALLGMNLFAYRVKYNDKNEVDLTTEDAWPNSNFNTFAIALLTVFVILTGDGWANTYYQHYRAVGGAIATFYFIPLVVLGQYVILMLFIAVLVDNYEKSSKEVQQQKSSNIFTKNMSKLKKKAQNQAKNLCFCSKKNQIQSQKSSNNSTSQELSNSIQNMTEKNTLKINKSDNQSNKCREYLAKIVTSQPFDYFILLLILCSSIQLILQNPLYNTQSTFFEIVSYFDYIFTGFYIIESLLKIAAFGLILNGPKSYLRNGWNIIDILIVLISIIDISLPNKNFKIFKVIRLLRVMRPLRLITKNEGLKLSIQALIKVIPALLNVILIFAFFLFIFAIMGTSYFKGGYFKCYRDQLSSITYPSDLHELIYSKWDCINYGGEWLRADRNFDDVLNSMMTLLIVSQTIDWSKVMYEAMALRGINLEPITLTKNYNGIYFVFFIIFSNFLITNLFAGVVVSVFTEEKQNLDNASNALITNKQRFWLETKLLILEAKPKHYLKEPQNKFRKFLYKIARHRYFERFILLIISLNTILLGMQWFEQPHYLTEVYTQLSFSFSIIYGFEIIIKVIAYDKRFFYDFWNIFDLIIILGSLAGFLLQRFLKYNSLTPSAVIRTFRLSRLFKIMRSMKSLQIIFETFLMVLPALLNVGGLLLLLLFIYAILGMNLFASVIQNGAITDEQNFQNIQKSFLTLMIMSTGENFNDIMQQLGSKFTLLNQCVNNPTYDQYKQNGFNPVGCGSRYAALIFCFTYLVLMILVFLNLFIAIIVDGYRFSVERDEKMIKSELRERFREVWSKYDEDANSFIDKKHINDFLFDLGEPLGWSQEFRNDRQLQEDFIDKIDFNLYKNKEQLQFIDVFEKLSLHYVVSLEVKSLLENRPLNKENQEKIFKLTEAIQNQFLNLEQQEEIGLAKNIQKKKNELMKLMKVTSDGSTRVKQNQSFLQDVSKEIKNMTGILYKGDEIQVSDQDLGGLGNIDGNIEFANQIDLNEFEEFKIDEYKVSQRKSFKDAENEFYENPYQERDNYNIQNGVISNKYQRIQRQYEQ